jgi:hypothetical protein
MISSLGLDERRREGDLEMKSYSLKKEINKIGGKNGNKTN